MSKRKKYLITILVTISLLGIIGCKVSIKDGRINFFMDKILYFNRNVDTEEKHEIQHVKMFAISLNVQGEYDENVRSTPLTCKINIDKMVRLIYIDGAEEIGSKYIEYNKPAGTLLQPTKKGYDFVKWTNKDDDEINETSVIATNTNYYIYANWDVISSELIVDPNSGTWEGKTEQQTFNLSYKDTKKISNPTRTGYTFAGWKLTGADSTLDGTTFTMGTEKATLQAQWKNNPPKVEITNIKYTNSGESGLDKAGLLNDGTETITITVKATDVEDGIPTVDLACSSGNLCSSFSVINKTTSGNIFTFTVKVTKYGVGLIEATAVDTIKEKATDNNVIYVYGPGGALSDSVKYTNTTYDSMWFDVLDGCYISNFTFNVQFDTGHSNGDATDIMVVYGRTESGKIIQLYRWKGNMQTTLHVSDLSIFNNQTEKIRQIGFYTYSPHDDCAKKATITYSIKYDFDMSLLDSTYSPISGTLANTIPNIMN